MKIFVAGATGRVATGLIRLLSAAGHSVRAGARHPENVVKLDNVTPVPMDLHASVTQLAEIIKGADAIYFTAGSRGKDLLQTDAFGAVKLMQAAEAAGIRRFILLSSVFADTPERWDDPNLVNITDYNIAKFFADQWLMHRTTLDYTILQPGNLMEEAGSGRVQFDVPRSMPNAIANVAAVLAQLAAAENTYGKVIRMADGTVPIAEAVAAV